MRKIRINAEEIVRDMKQLLRDDELIEKYKLSMRSLSKVKIKLLERGWITEGDLGGSIPSPNPRGPGDDIVRQSDESTEVDLLQDLTERVALLPTSKWKPSKMRVAVPEAGSGKGRTHADYCEESISRLLEEDPTSVCPKCGKVRSSPSADTCAHCGIVFAKYEKALEESGVAIWY